MINLIFFVLGMVGGWFLKFAFDFYHNFKDVEQIRASKVDDILTRFEAINLVKNEKIHNKPI